MKTLEAGRLQPSKIYYFQGIVHIGLLQAFLADQDLWHVQYMEKEKTIMKMKIIKNPRSMTIAMNYHDKMEDKCQEDLVVTVGHQSGSGQGTT